MPIPISKRTQTHAGESLTISAEDEKTWIFAGSIVVSRVVRCVRFARFRLVSAENFRFNSGDEGAADFCGVLGGFDRPTDPGKTVGRAEISFLIVSIDCFVSTLDDGSV